MHCGMMSQIGVAHQGADAQAAVGKLFDLVERQAIDVDELGGPLDIQLHQVEQGCSAGDEPDCAPCCAVLDCAAA